MHHHDQEELRCTIAPVPALEAWVFFRWAPDAFCNCLKPLFIMYECLVLLINEGTGDIISFVVGTIEISPSLQDNKTGEIFTHEPDYQVKRSAPLLYPCFSATKGSEANARDNWLRRWHRTHLRSTIVFQSPERLRLGQELELAGAHRWKYDSDEF